LLQKFEGPLKNAVTFFYIHKFSIALFCQGLFNPVPNLGKDNALRWSLSEKKY
jgi:hypothetical protein